jgi:signal transduction histidine kinase
MKTQVTLSGKAAGIAAFLLLALTVGMLSERAEAQSPRYKYQETINLVALVNNAAKEISFNGEKVFKEFMTKGTVWRNGDTYVFVIGLKGEVYAHEDPAKVGQNDYELKDVHGKPIVQWFIRKGLGIGQCGWVHYEWLRPETGKTAWKTSYVKLVKAPSGNVYVVGSGLYNMRMERQFAVEAVDDAINLIRTMGKDAFRILKDSTSEFVYKDTYVFVLDTLGTTLVNPAEPALEGTVRKDMKDSAGKAFIADMIRMAVDNSQGWVDYLWPKPGTDKAVRKSSFVKKITVRGEVLVTGTGVYLD